MRKITKYLIAAWGMYGIFYVGYRYGFKNGYDEARESQGYSFQNVERAFK